MFVAAGPGVLVAVGGLGVLVGLGVGEGPGVLVAVGGLGVLVGLGVGEGPAVLVGPGVFVGRGVLVGNCAWLTEPETGQVSAMSANPKIRSTE